jgi:beta-aspartyl-peptidase (threonine type)
MSRPAKIIPAPRRRVRPFVANYVTKSAALAGFLAACALAPGAALAAPAYDYFLTGNPADAQPAHTTGGLLLAGGGTDNDDAFRWFVKCAGGGDIVILRASGKDGYNDYLFSKIGGVDSVETLLFHDRSASSDPRVLEIIAHADGIFLAGGDQSNYVKYWKGTPVAAALDAHVRAGKPLGGTSAGLAVLGEFAYSALEPRDLTSVIALNDPYDRQITLEKDFLHLALLRGVITDTHFMIRARLGRSLVFLARLVAEQKSAPRVLGLAVDEKAALCVEPDGSARLFTGAPEGRAWLLVPSAAPEVLAAGQPLTFRNIRVIALGPKSSFNLTTLAVTQPAAISTVSVVAGKLSQQP